MRLERTNQTKPNQTKPGLAALFVVLKEDTARVTNDGNDDHPAPVTVVTVTVTVVRASLSLSFQQMFQKKPNQKNQNQKAFLHDRIASRGHPHAVLRTKSPRIAL